MKECCFFLKESIQSFFFKKSVSQVYYGDRFKEMGKTLIKGDTGTLFELFCLWAPDPRLSLPLSQGNLKSLKKMFAFQGSPLPISKGFPM